MAAALLFGVTQAAAPPLDRAAIAAAVRGAAEVFAREYFDAALGRRVESDINQRLQDGRYGKAQSHEELAGLLTSDLFELTRDKHVAVTLRRRGGGGGAAAERRDIPTTAGFRRTEILDGKIGILDLAFFLRPAEHQEALAAAMKTLQPARALILDMRANGGGSPDTVAMLVSYLLDTPSLPLFDIVHRDGTRNAYTTLAVPPAERDARRPVYVLTSSKTFSAGEGLAFLVQELKRGLVVGEVTAGAANPGRAYRIDETFEIVVPNGQVLTSVGRRSWEGAGVTPDIRVPASDALATAQKLASELLIQ